MQMLAPAADGNNGTVTDHVAARQAQRLDIGAALSQAADGHAVQQSAALQVHHAEPSAMREDITQYWRQEGENGSRQEHR